MNLAMCSWTAAGWCFIVFDFVNQFPDRQMIPNTLFRFISRGLLRKAYAVRLFRCIDADEQVSFA